MGLLIFRMPILFCVISSDGVRSFVSFEQQLLIAQTGAATIFALALLCSGQSASLVATVGGQIVSEGFIRWHVSVSIWSDGRFIALPHTDLIYLSLSCGASLRDYWASSPP